MAFEDEPKQNDHAKRFGKSAVMELEILKITGAAQLFVGASTLGLTAFLL